MQKLIDVGAELGISIELDTSDRTRPGEGRGGASPMATIALVILAGAVEAVAEQLLSATLAWVRRHKAGAGGGDPGDFDEDMVFVTLYGPDGKVIKSIQVTASGDVDDTDRHTGS